jgi:O-antigen/teichoic acid export membrane protein
LIRETVKHTAALAISNVIARFLAMLFFVLLARSLSVADYGLFRYLITLASIYGLVFSAIPTALAKFFSENRDNEDRRREYLDNSVILMIILYILVAFVILIFSPNKMFLLLFAFALMIDLFYIGFARGLLDLVKLGGYKLIENIIQLALLISAFILFQNLNLVYTVVFYSFSGVIAIIMFEIFRPELKVRWRFSKCVSSQIIKYSLSFTVGSVGWALLLGVPSVYIEQFHGIEQVGYYSVIATLMQVFSFLPDAVFTLIVPKVAGLKDKMQIIKPLKLAAWGCFFISMLIFIPMYYYRELILTLLFTDKYLPAAIIIFPLSLAQIFLILNQIYGTAFHGLGKPGIPSIVITIAGGVNIVVGYFFTKSYGILGASYSLTISALIAWVLIAIKWRVWVKDGELKEMTSV